MTEMTNEGADTQYEDEDKEEKREGDGDDEEEDEEEPIATQTIGSTAWLILGRS